MFVNVTPQNVFSFANASRRADVLDQRCVDAAVRAAIGADLPQDSLLLINTEPAVAHTPRAGHPALTEACERFQVAFELTERHLLAHPRALLEKVAAISADGIAVAVDDVGTHPDSLAEDDRVPLRVAGKDIVAEFSRHIEEQARHAIDRPMVLAALQRAQDFSNESRQLYQDLAATSPLVVVLGCDVPADLGGGVRGIELQPGDPLCEEWVLVTLGADTCRALVARELPGPARHDSDRRFEFLITSDRALVTKAARGLLSRVV